jgi:hypothetical protein
MDASSPSDQTERIPADHQLRRRSILLVVLAVVVGAVLLWVLHIRLERIQQTAEQDLVAAADGALRLVQICAWCGGLGFVGIGLWFGRLGWQIHASGQYPPPGMKVIKDTPLRTGPSAAISLAAGTLGMAYLYHCAAAVLR